MWCWQMERRLGGARECATVTKYRDGVYKLVFASGDKKKMKPAQLLQRKHKLLEAPEGKPPLQEVVDDEYDPLILLGCVLEVPAWPYNGVRDNNLVVVADTKVGGRQSARSESKTFRGRALQTKVD